LIAIGGFQKEKRVISKSPAAHGRVYQKTINAKAQSRKAFLEKSQRYSLPDKSSEQRFSKAF
jgi:hypothetical protein